MQFKNFITEALPSVQDANLDSSIIMFIMRSLHLSVSTHITHLLSHNYSEHIAIGEFYDDIRDLADKLAESSIGLDLTITPETYTEGLIFKYDIMKFKNDVQDYRSHCAALINMTNTSDLMNLNNILVDIQACIDTLNYKLKLI